MTIQNRRKTGTRIWRYVFDIISAVPVLRGQMTKITTKLSLLAVYRPEEIPALAAKFFLISSGVSAAAILAGILLCPDMLSTLLVCVFAILLHDIAIEKQLNKIYAKVLKECSVAIGAIEQEYLRTQSISEALETRNLPRLMSRPISEIHEAITGADGEAKIQRFMSATPFKPLKTLAIVSYNLATRGDTTDNNGISGFIQALSLLRGDVNMEKERLALQKSRFRMMVYLPLVGIIGIGPLEGFLTDAAPAMAIRYNSILGFVLRMLTITVSITAYIIINRVNSPVSVKSDDRGKWTVNLLRLKWFEKLINNIAVKPVERSTKRLNQPTAYEFLSARLNSAISKMEVKHFYTKKLVFAATVFAATLVLMTVSVILGRNFILNTTAPLTLVGGAVRTPEETAALRRVDAVYFEAEGRITDTELRGVIKRFLPKYSEMQINDEVKRVKDKYSTWINLYFKWWFVFAAFAVSLLGWFLPDIILTFRKIFVKNEETDDFMQLQTLVAILMHTDMDTLSVIEQLARQSTVHKDMLLWAFHAVPAAPDMEMERLERKASLPEMKAFVQKLKTTISDMSLKDAFANLLAERESLQRLRHIAMEATIRSKANICSLVSIIPTILLIVAEFALPLFMLAMGEYNAAGATLG